MNNKQEFERTHFPYIYYVIRPVSHKCVPLAMRSGLTPNQVTLASIILYFIGIALFGVGGQLFQILGITAAHVGLILDCVDGELARSTGKTSQKGGYLDAVGGYFVSGLLFASIGLGLTRKPDLAHALLNNIMFVSRWVYLSIGLSTGLFLLLIRIIGLRYKLIFNNSLRDNKKGVLQAVTCFGDFLLPLIFLGTVVKVLSFILLAYFLYYSVGFLCILYNFFKSCLK